MIIKYDKKNSWTKDVIYSGVRFANPNNFEYLPKCPL